MTPTFFECGTPIHLNSLSTISNVFFDGCHYYFTDTCGCMIAKTNKDFQEEQCYKLQKNYSCFCYDPCECCFWATCSNHNRKIFKLNCEFKEIDCIVLDCAMSGVITGLSYNCCCNTLTISIGNMIACVNKESGCCTPIYSVYNQLITSVLSLCPGYIITSINNKKQRITVLNDDGNVEDFFYTPSNTSIIKNILYNPCTHHCHCEYLELFVLKNGCYPYIYRISLDEIDIGYTPACCNNFVCNACCEPHPPIPPHPTPNACNDVLESIALVEAALAHILNAEGEKLQKVIAESDNLELILCTNKEVNKTVINITHLEQVLYAKLSALQCICEPDMPCDGCCNNCDCDNHKPECE